MADASHSNNLQSGNIRTTEGPILIIEWDIQDYKSLFENRKFNAIAKSPTFVMRGSKWSFQISHLLSSFGEKLVIVYLFRHAYEIKYQSISHLVAIQVNEKEICGGYRRTCVFGKTEEFCGIAGKEKNLINCMTSKDITILCTVFAEEQMFESSQGTTSATDEGIGILSSNLKELFINGENSDFVMKVSGREFQVHKSILCARSPVLSAMLHHDMVEKHSNITEIVDCEPEAFQQFLFYLYSGRLEELSWDNVFPLYSLGDKYDLGHLRKICVEFMEDNLCVDAFCNAISLAVKHNELTLLGVAEDFFNQNIRSILLSTKWLNLMQESPVICNELFLKCHE